MSIVLAVRYKPLDTQASVGLTKCISALSGMEVSHHVVLHRAMPLTCPYDAQRTWTSALRVRHLIQNAQVLIDNTYIGAGAPPGHNVRQQKRRAQVAFEQDIDLLYSGHTGSTTNAPPLPLPRRQPQPLPEPPQLQLQPQPQHHAPTRSHHARAPYDVVSSQLDISQTYPAGIRSAADTGTDAFVRYMPGYDSWWPVLDQQQQQTGSQVAVGMQVPSTNEFTFGVQQFSPDFLQAMRDPVIHFPSAFAHQY